MCIKFAYLQIANVLVNIALREKINGWELHWHRLQSVQDVPSISRF